MSLRPAWLLSLRQPPPRSLPSLLQRTWRELARDDALDRAAAVAYYMLVSALPLALLAIAGAGTVLGASENVERRLLQLVEIFMPTAREELQEVLFTVIHGSAVISWIGLLGLLMAGSRLFGSLEKAVNAAWDCVPRVWWKSRLLSLGMTLLVEGLVILSFGLSLLRRLGELSQRFLPEFLGPHRWGWAVLPVLVSFTSFLVLYRFLPNRRVTWRAAAVGAGAAALLFEASKAGFGFYADNFGNYNLLYGSVAGLVILVLWAYVVALITLVGAELGSEFEEMYLGIQRSHRTRTALGED